MEKKEKQIFAELAPFCAPLYFLKHRNASANEITNNATVSLIDTGKRKIFVTAYHVWKSYLDKRKNNSNLTLAIGTGNNSPTVILDDVDCIDGCEEVLDIAVLQFKNSNYYPSTTPEQKKFYQLKWGFSKPPLKGEALFFVGFPGLQREAIEKGILSHWILFADFIESVSETHISSVDVNGDRVQRVYKAGLKDFTDWGGISGAPAYVFRGDYFRLVGFLKETWTKNDIVLCSRADFINLDGTLDHLKIPH